MRSLEYSVSEYRDDRYVMPYYNFGGGIYDTNNSDRLSNNEYACAYNLDVVNDGSLIMRDNFVVSDTSPSPVAEDKNYESVTVFDAGNSYDIIGILDNNIVKIPSNTVIYENFGKTMNSVQFGGRLYMIGNGKLLVYDGDKCEDIATFYKDEIDKMTEEEKQRNDLEFVVKGTILTVAQGRLIISGIPDEPNDVYFSEPFSPWYFNSKDFWDVVYPNHSDNDRVTHLEEYADGILIFKRSSIYALLGTIGGADTQLYRINAPTGTMSPKTVRRVDNFLMYVGTDKKVYALYGVDKYKLNVYILSGKISNKMSTIDDTERENIVATYYKGKYMIVHHKNVDNKIVSESLNLYVLDNVNTDIISNPIWSFYNHIDIWGFIEIPGQDLQMYGRYSTRIYKYSATATEDYDINNEVADRDTIPYTVYIKFKEYNLDLPESNKIFRAGWIQFDKIDRTQVKDFKHNVYIDKRQIYLAYNEDQGIDQFGPSESKWSSDGSNVLWDDFYWGGANNYSYYFRINAKGRTVQNELKFTTYGEKLSILGTSFELKVKHPQRKRFNTGFQRGN